MKFIVPHKTKFVFCLKKCFIKNKYKNDTIVQTCVKYELINNKN